MTDEYRSHLSKNGTNGLTKHNKDPEFRKLNSQRIINWWNKPEVKEFKSNQVKEQWQREREFMMQSIIDFYGSEDGIESVKNRTRKTGSYVYNDKKYKSTWEVVLAEFFDNHNIFYEYESKCFEYIFEDKKHIYIPDFYLPEYNLIIEVKPEYFISYDVNQTKKNSVIGYSYMFVSKEIIEGIISSSETIENRFLEEISKMRSE